MIARRDEEFYTKSLPDKVTYKWKGNSWTKNKIYQLSKGKSNLFLCILDGCAVDPDCGLEDNAHVYSQLMNKRCVKFSVILGLVDIENDKNSYYRIQLLESNNQKL